MNYWRTSIEPGTRRVTHAFPPGSGHALCAPAVAQLFEVLRVSSCLWNGKSDGWLAIHAEGGGVRPFEAEHGRDIERGPYNVKLFGEVLRTGVAVRGSHAGFSDLFVPVLVNAKVAAVLVTGPFSLSRPTAPEILERWDWLTGRRGHLANPQFAAYLSASLSTLVLEGKTLGAFERLHDCLAKLLGGVGRADEQLNEAVGLRTDLERTRIVEHVWQAVHAMVDERFPRAWHSMGKFYDLLDLGLSHVPDHVMVGLSTERKAGRDPVEQAVARDALQRKSATIAQELGNVVSGQVGEHGVVLLSAGRSPVQRCAERVSAAAQQLGFSLCFGLCAATESDPLGRSYRSALSAAEVALVRGSKTVTAGAPRSLGELRRELGRVLDHDPRTLAGKFEPYLEAVATRCGHRVDPARGHLEAGFERLAEPLLANGALDDKGFSELFETLSRSADAASTLGDLLAVYRRAVVDLSEAVRKPGATGQERGLRRALDHMHAHFTEGLRLSGVARMAGISPDYFSRLLKKRERMTFERYLRGLRIERAKQLLIDTGVNIDRVARLSGFASAAYFCRVFRDETGTTPGVFRRRNATTSRDAVRKSARLVRHPAS